MMHHGAGRLDQTPAGLAGRHAACAPHVMLRVLLALSAGAVQILRQRGFWVALVASFLVPRVFQPGGHKVHL